MTSLPVVAAPCQVRKPDLPHPCHFEGEYHSVHHPTEENQTRREQKNMAREIMQKERRESKVIGEQIREKERKREEMETK